MQDVRGFLRELIGVNRVAVDRRRAISRKIVILIGMIEQLVYKLETTKMDRFT